ncbi:MAG: hypothetical protein M3R02_18305 [Chloroflexota bacterium]|nr:hypothetical protein [Chloroflexota bacterium]
MDQEGSHIKQRRGGRIAIVPDHRGRTCHSVPCGVFSNRQG